MPAKRQKAPPTNNGHLQEAMALLIQNQATFMSAFLSYLSRSEERFERIERRLDNIERVLAEHHQILIDLPEAIREKIGFKARR